MMAGPGGAPGSSSPYGRAIFEAWNLLVTEGLLAPDFAREPRFFVTRHGQAVAALGVDGRRQLAAERRLSFELHPRLETRIRRQFLMGEHEAAAMIAFREVEIYTRELAKFGNERYGRVLMQEAFKQEGPLADPALEPTEQTALMQLFTGAYGVFKNPSSHREVSYTDPIQAAEVVLFADLLLRMLDQIPSS